MSTEIKKERLSEQDFLSYTTEQLEDVIWDEELIIDKGYFLCFYANHDGIHSENSSGQTFFIEVKEDMSFKELLELTSEYGSICNNTLTIRIVSKNDDYEIDMCKRNPLSR